MLGYIQLLINLHFRMQLFELTAKPGYGGQQSDIIEQGRPQVSRNPAGFFDGGIDIGNNFFQRNHLGLWILPHGFQFFFQRKLNGRQTAANAVMNFLGDQLTLVFLRIQNRA